MKKIIIPSILFILYGCNGSYSNTQYSTTDSLNGITDSGRIDEIKDSIKSVLDSELSEKLSDTTGIYLAPVKIIDKDIVKEDYSDYRNVWLRYKNVSNKTIEAIRFKWTGLNAFGDPADMGGNFEKGMGGGYDDNKLLPGKTSEGTWKILSDDAKKITKAWPSEIVFSDGSKWEFNK